jgi:hypothetical protein
MNTARFPVLVGTVAVWLNGGCGRPVAPVGIEVSSQVPLMPDGTLDLREITRRTKERSPPLPGFTARQTVSSVPSTPASTKHGTNPTPPAPVIGYQSMAGDADGVEIKVVEWMDLILDLVIRRACPQKLRDERRCRPGFTRNDTGDPCGVFDEAQRTIRYNWSCIERESKKLHEVMLADNSAAAEERSQMSFALGIVAHEYGHYLDAESGNMARMDIRILPALVLEVPLEVEYSDNKLKELLGDFVAGCVLGDSVLLNAFIVHDFFAGMNPKDLKDADYPTPGQRIITFNAAWDRCNGKVPRATALEELMAVLSPPSPPPPSPPVPMTTATATTKTSARGTRRPFRTTTSAPAGTASTPLQSGVIVRDEEDPIRASVEDKNMPPSCRTAQNSLSRANCLAADCKDKENELLRTLNECIEHCAHTKISTDEFKECRSACVSTANFYKPVYCAFDFK